MPGSRGVIGEDARGGGASGASPDGWFWMWCCFGLLLGLAVLAYHDGLMQEKVEDLRAELQSYKKAAEDMERGWKACQDREGRRIDDLIWHEQQRDWRQGR